MESERKEKVQPPRRQSLKKRPKTEIEKADQEKFNKVLDGCKRILFNAMDNGDDIFELLDPLISDTQCHLHSVLILNSLHKCYDERSNYYATEKLEEKDTEILSYAVLFSLLKAEHKDILGFTLYEMSIGHFNGLILPSKKRETFRIIEARKKFNSYSVAYIKSVASENIRQIIHECQAVSLAAPLKFLPCFATYIALLDYIIWKKLPIIVSMVTVVKQVVDEGANCQYNMRSNDVRYYEFREDENTFLHKEELGEFEKNVPTLAFNCYSLISDDTQELVMDYEIRDLLMLCTASHIQLPKNSKLPVGYEDGEKYARCLYEKCDEVFDEYIKYYELGQKLDLIGAQYARLPRSTLEQGDENTTFTIERNREDIVFNVDHVYLSNYSREHQRVKSLDSNLRVDQREAFNMDVRKLIYDGIVQELFKNC